MKSVIRMDEVIVNSERKFGSALSYHPVEVVRYDGEVDVALFTTAEIDSAVDRAEKNAEDVAKVLRGRSWFTRLMDRLFA